MGGLAIQYAKIPETKINSSLRIQRTKSSQPIKIPADRILFLQKTIGNQAVQRLIKSGTLQSKLKIGQPGDKNEREAYRVADEMTRMAEPKSVSLEDPHIQHVCEGCEEEELRRQPIEEEEEEELRRQPEEEDEEKLLQTKEISGQNAETTPDLESCINAIRGGGHPLPESERSFFEPRFGTDFSKVRMHADSQASESARALNAHAFTLGHDVIFGAGQYKPGTTEGRSLLAHELMHVVQQYSPGPHPIRRMYALNELQGRVPAGDRGVQVSTPPEVFFFPGTVGLNTHRKAFIFAGIHGDEAPSIQLGIRVKNELLSSNGLRPFFNTILIPQANYLTHNRTIPGLDHTHPIIQTITRIVEDFQPERILSIHSIALRPQEEREPLSGIYLDPIRPPGTMPPSLGTETEREQAFTHVSGRMTSQQLGAMNLTERMIEEVRSRGSQGQWVTSGNIAGMKRGEQFRENLYPGGLGRSGFNLLYPLQSMMCPTPGDPNREFGSNSPRTSFGVWASGLSWGPTVITMEAPEGRSRNNWSLFLPAVWEFLDAHHPYSEGETSTPEEREAAMERFAQQHDFPRNRVIWTPIGPQLLLGIGTRLE